MCLSWIVSGQEMERHQLQIALDTIEIVDMPGVQSFAYGQWEGKWLLVGGRVEGLHRRQPWASFLPEGNNTSFYVVDPENKQWYQAPLTLLDSMHHAHLSSTNMQFYQVDSILYCLGGYGWNPVLEEHITFDKMAIIHLPSTIDAIVHGAALDPHIKQIDCKACQLTGGKLKVMDDVFYLLGGQLFMGQYNPDGPDAATGFVQQYANAVRRFKLHGGGTDLHIDTLDGFADSLLFHKRDYNALEQITPDGKSAIRMFSGVFQYEENIPFLNSVLVWDDGFAEDQDFEQYYNHYHCPALPIYAEQQNTMYNLFFGGIAQYYEMDGMFIEDKSVPFVKTIAQVRIDSLGVMHEEKYPFEMPTYVGAAAEFIPAKAVPMYRGEIIDYDRLPVGKSLLGYIVGGIESDADSIFFTTEGEASRANTVIYRVWISK